MDKVMWAYQVRQSRTWYSSRLASFLASWKHSSIAHRAVAMRQANQAGAAEP